MTDFVPASRRELAERFTSDLLKGDLIAPLSWPNPEDPSDITKTAAELAAFAYALADAIIEKGRMA